MGKFIRRTVLILFITILLPVLLLGGGTTFILGFIFLDAVDRKLDREIAPRKTQVEIDSQKFSFPKEYISYATKAEEPYKDMAIIKLEFLWPDFMPTRLANSEELSAAKNLSNYNVGHLWITKAFPEKVKQSLSINPYPNKIVKTEAEGKFYGLEKYQHYERKYKSEELIARTESYILKNDSGVGKWTQSLTNNEISFQNS